MDRLRLPNRPLTILLLAAGAIVFTSGCSLVATGMWMIQGGDQKAEYAGLKGMKIAVICRPVSSLQYRYPTVGRDLAKKVGSLLQKNVPHATVIDQREVAEWTDEKSWDEFTEIGKALHADMVVGIDLDEFDLYQSQGLYQGKATMSKLVVYDMHKPQNDPPVFEQSIPQIHYPPNSPIPAGDKPEAEFRTQFIKVLSERVAGHFYDHDPTAEFASDSTAL